MECSKGKIVGFVSILAIVGIYFFLSATDLFVKDESTFEKNAPKCIPLFEDANLLISKAIDSTKRILKDPEFYGNISAKCEAAIECTEDHQIQMKTYHLDGKYNPCMFFVFYTNQFSTCANQLIAKVGDQIPCIEAVFHDVFSNKTEKCEVWKTSQPCIVRAILNTCDTFPVERMKKNPNTMSYYADEIYNLTPAFCIDL